MSRWLLLGAGIGVGVLIVFALVAVFVLQKREPPLYPPDTPQGVTQRYLQALAREAWGEAYAYLAPDLQARCPEDRWERQVAYSRSTLEKATVYLRSVEYKEGGVATVRVVFTQQEPPRPFQLFPQEFESEQVFRLKRQEDGNWRFAVFPWPLWPEIQCV